MEDAGTGAADDQQRDAENIWRCAKCSSKKHSTREHAPQQDISETPVPQRTVENY